MLFIFQRIFFRLFSLLQSNGKSNIGCGRLYFAWFGFFFYYLTNKPIRSLSLVNHLHFQYTELDKRKSNDFWYFWRRYVCMLFTLDTIYAMVNAYACECYFARRERVEYERTEKKLFFCVRFFVFRSKKNNNIILLKNLSILGLAGFRLSDCIYAICECRMFKCYYEFAGE